MNCLHFQRSGFYSHCNAEVRNLRGLFKPALQMRSLQKPLEKLMQWKRELRLLYSTFSTRCKLNSIFFSLMKCCVANDRKTLFSLPCHLSALYSKVHGVLDGSQRQSWPKLLCCPCQNVLQDSGRSCKEWRLLQCAPLPDSLGQLSWLGEWKVWITSWGTTDG